MQIPRGHPQAVRFAPGASLPPAYRRPLTRNILGKTISPQTSWTRSWPCSNRLSTT